MSNNCDRPGKDTPEPPYRGRPADACSDDALIIPERFYRPDSDIEPERIRLDLPPNLIVQNAEITRTCEDLGQGPDGDAVTVAAGAFTTRIGWLSVEPVISADKLRYIKTLAAGVITAITGDTLTEAELVRLLKISPAQASDLKDRVNTARSEVQSLAQQRADNLLRCFWTQEPVSATCPGSAETDTPPPVLDYVNWSLSLVNNPAEASGPEGGNFVSSTSSEDALSQAQSASTALLKCLYTNDEVTVDCTTETGNADGFPTGTPWSFTVPARAFGASSKSQADDVALNFAKTQLDCYYPSEELTVTCPVNDLTGVVASSSDPRLENEGGGVFTVPAGYVSSYTSQEDADTTAAILALGTLNCFFPCDPHSGSCLSPSVGASINVASGEFTSLIGKSAANTIVTDLLLGSVSCTVRSNSISLNCVDDNPLDVNDEVEDDSDVFVGPTQADPLISPEGYITTIVDSVIQNTATGQYIQNPNLSDIETAKEDADTEALNQLKAQLSCLYANEHVQGSCPQNEPPAPLIIYAIEIAKEIDVAEFFSPVSQINATSIAQSFADSLSICITPDQIGLDTSIALPSTSGNGGRCSSGIVTADLVGTPCVQMNDATPHTPPSVSVSFPTITAAVETSSSPGSFGGSLNSSAVPADAVVSPSSLPKVYYARVSYTPESDSRMYPSTFTITSEKPVGLSLFERSLEFATVSLNEEIRRGPDNTTDNDDKACFSIQVQHPCPLQLPAIDMAGLEVEFINGNSNSYSFSELISGYNPNSHDHWSFVFAVAFKRIDQTVTPSGLAVNGPRYTGSGDPYVQESVRIPIVVNKKLVSFPKLYRENLFCVGSKGVLTELI